MDLEAINAELSAIAEYRKHKNMKLDPNSGGGQIFGYNIDTVAPAGQAIAVCLDIRDQFGVDRKKFQSEEIEKQDVTRFLFGFLDPQGRPHLVQTFEFKISGNPGSNLVDFLKAWTSRDPYGFDYLELKGTGAMITVGVKQSTRTPGKWYNTISAISPVYPTLQAQIPQPAVFAQQVQKALTAPPMPNKTGQPAPGAPPPGAFSPAPVYQQPPTGFAAPGGPGFVGAPNLPPAAPVRKFWVAAPGAAQPVPGMTGEQVSAGLLRYPQGMLICPEDAPHVGWVAPAQLGIFPPPQAAPMLPAAPPMLPGMPPLPPMPGHAPDNWGTHVPPPLPPGGPSVVPGVLPASQGGGMPPLPGTLGAPAPAPGTWQQPPAQPGQPPLQDDIPF